jgi:hypothetical protein
VPPGTLRFSWPPSIDLLCQRVSAPCTLSEPAAGSGRHAPCSRRTSPPLLSIRCCAAARCRCPLQVVLVRQPSIDRCGESCQRRKISSRTAPLPTASTRPVLRVWTRRSLRTWFRALRCASARDRGVSAPHCARSFAGEQLTPCPAAT